MHPVRLRLPEDSLLAAALWKVLEQGIGARIHIPPPTAVRPRSPQRQHLETLLSLLRLRLTDGTVRERAFWVERRELGDLLLVLDEGLRWIGRENGGNPGGDLQRRAVRDFLDGLKQQLPAPRKPAQRQAGVPKPEPVLAASAAGD